MNGPLVLLIAPFIIQGLIMVIDEFYFHRLRGLTLWEKIGHPLDTITLLICYFFIMNYSPDKTHFIFFLSLAFFSCLFVTKDEFIHHEKCCAMEQWLHGILFVLHPLVLMGLLFYWRHPQNKDFLTPDEYLFFKTFIEYQFIAILLFLSYQIIYWNIPWKKIKRQYNLQMDKAL